MFVLQAGSPIYIQQLWTSVKEPLGTRSYLPGRAFALWEVFQTSFISKLSRLMCISRAFTYWHVLLIYIWHQYILKTSPSLTHSPRGRSIYWDVTATVQSIWLITVTVKSCLMQIHAQRRKSTRMFTLPMTEDNPPMLRLIHCLCFSQHDRRHFKSW